MLTWERLLSDDSFGWVIAGLRGWFPDELAAPKLQPKYNFNKLTRKRCFPVLEYRSKASYKHFAYIYIIYK